MTIGTIGIAGALAGWFVRVKDDVGRFPTRQSLWATAGVRPDLMQLTPRHYIHRVKEGPATL
jgi:hypothetical protein